MTRRRLPGAPEQRIPRQRIRSLAERTPVPDPETGAILVGVDLAAGPSWSECATLSPTDRPAEIWTSLLQTVAAMAGPPRPVWTDLETETQPATRWSEPMSLGLPAPPTPTGRRGPGDRTADDPPEGEPNCWRVENADGRGMYQGAAVGLETTYAMSEDRHPMPTSDSALMAAVGGYTVWHSSAVIYQDWRFGFASLGQLRTWLYRDEWRAELDRAGFRVSAIRAEVLRIGDTQAMLLASSATRLWTMSLLEI